MKKNIFFIFFVVIPILSFSQENFIDEFGRKQGKWTAKYDNGTIRYKGDFKDDKPQGIFYFYYDNGNLHITQDFFHDGSAAATHIYYKNGFLKAAWHYYSCRFNHR